MIRHLFVYGTLDPEAGILGQLNVRFSIVSRASVAGMRISGTEYPAAVPGAKEDGELVEGMLLELTDVDEDLPKLDEYEEYYPNAPERSLYIRKEVDVILESRKIVKSWIYWYNRDRMHIAAEEQAKYKGMSPL